MGELEKRIDRLREEETRLKAACEERERQKSALESDFHIDDRFRQVCTVCTVSPPIFQNGSDFFSVQWLVTATSSG